MKPKTLLLAFFAVAGLGRAAFGAGEKEWQLGARAGAGTVTVDDRTTWGFAAALDLAYGLSDSWALSGSVATSFHSVAPANMMDTRPAGKIETLTALGGLTYTIDILRLIPYADLELGVLQLGGAVQAPRILFVSALGLGADYFVTRRFTAGVHFQYLFAPADLISNAMSLGGSPYSFTATLRVSRIF